ncbi:Lar family restriction alleviation protein [Novosphingobium sp. YJ-S2-02]|uniref:Lar family restriction alleviation protein n=1 Tax=Novosphingobium aureum TaxID=2792964 RepID=A0A931HD42_9SPHN|nr:Lar family restriction alleviation protein [Novosphingobium aureum]MBH0113219.1 Lar family restriction alleviation protein [Novosphingobium aureum]
MSKELKPCTHCKSPGFAVDRPNRIPFVECRKCGMEILGNTIDEAITAWNSRPSEDLIAARTLLAEAYQVVGQLVADIPEHPEIVRILDLLSKGEGTLLPFAYVPPKTERIAQLEGELSAEREKVATWIAMADRYVVAHDQCEPWRNGESASIPYVALVTMKDAMRDLRAALAKHREGE